MKLATNLCLSAIVLIGLVVLGDVSVNAGEPLTVSLRFQTLIGSDGEYKTEARDESWLPSETAIIVCDAWDLHHCLNAVRRLEQFAPRLDRVLKEARSRGVTIIHAPSDCMDAYRGHAARKRAMETPLVDKLPDQIESWCSQIPAEENAVYPIDQSDGGEDDDPQEHAEWAAKLKSMGRNPAAPWKKQTDLLTIDSEVDYISDRGDEVWSILERRGIQHVILTGVHTNMCVLGRPFGLRNLARNGKNVVLMRDMTDTMYNPKRWPYVSHFEGTRRIISHIEKYVCPTITSDQIIGGEPFRFRGDTESVPVSSRLIPATGDARRHWTTVSVPHGRKADEKIDLGEACWYRCVIRLPEEPGPHASLRIPESSFAESRGRVQLWINGHPAAESDGESLGTQFEIAEDVIEGGEANLFVLKLPSGRSCRLEAAPILETVGEAKRLAGQWQFRIGGDESLASMPLPAKFGGSPDIVFSMR